MGCVSSAIVIERSFIRTTINGKSGVQNLLMMMKRRRRRRRKKTIFQRVRQGLSRYRMMILREIGRTMKPRERVNKAGGSIDQDNQGHLSFRIGIESDAQ